MPDSVKPSPVSNGILDEIVAHKRQEVALRQQETSLETLIARLSELKPLNGFPFEAALASSKDVVRLIAEIKPSSPSAGVLQKEIDLGGILEAYNQYAVAISVLTDARYFGGTLERLAEVSQQSPHPTLCKDFILEPYQVYEARLAGAAAILLIVKILDDATLQTLHTLARSLGLTPVVEIQNEDELDRALGVGAKVLLINNRDLSTFTVSLDTTHRLVQALSSRMTAEERRKLQIISASGIENRADIDGLLPATSCFLIGSSLMKHPVEQLPQVLAALAGR